MNLPDINNIDSLVEAIGDIEVLGGISRSGSLDINGEFEPDRYIENIRDYVSDFAIREALKVMFNHTHYIAGLDGVIVYSSANRLEIAYSDGTVRVFKVEE